MNKLGTTIISLILLAGLLCSAIGANIAPSLVNYQARLTNPGGTPLNGNYTLVFTLYDAPTGGNIIWQETHSSVAVSDGFLSVLLGSGTIPVPLSDVAFGTDSRYLGVKIGADPEISPRSRMVATPYSQRVNTVDQARGGIISGQLEIHDDASKDGDLVSAKIKVVGASLRSVSIQPSLNVALLATATDGDEVVRLDALDTGGALRISGATNNQVASVSATGSGGNIAVNSVGGDVAAQLSASPSGGQVELYNSAKDVLLSSLKTKITPEELIQFGATAAESLIVLRRSSAAVGEIVVADYSNPTPATVSIGNGTALTMKNSIGQTVVDINDVSTSLSGNFNVEWSAAKAPGDGLINYGLGNTLNFNLGGGDPAHAENAFVVGENNTVDSKNVFVVGHDNLIDDDGSDPNLNGDNSAVFGQSNILKGDDAFCFGKGNYVGANRSATFGRLNYVDGGGNCFAFGDSNYVTSTGNSSITGGNYNLLTWSPNSVIAGGFSQTMDLSGYSFIAAGYDNNIVGTDEPTDRYNAIGGGYSNDISSAGYATVSGGRENVARGDYSIVSGGRLNEVDGDYSFAGGRRAKVGAAHDGSFIWADQTDADFSSSAANQFRARATGGVQFIAGIGPETGVELIPGSGSWSTLSDRNVKDNVEEVDVDELLERLAAMPIGTWNYKTQDASVRHIGPMAQDFFAAFGVGDKETLISSVDADGVALAAIQALYKRTQQLQDQAEEIEVLKAQLAEVQSLLAKLAAVKK